MPETSNASWLATRLRSCRTHWKLSSFDDNQLHVVQDVALANASRAGACCPAMNIGVAPLKGCQSKSIKSEAVINEHARNQCT